MSTEVKQEGEFKIKKRKINKRNRESGEKKIYYVRELQK